MLGVPSPVVRRPEASQRCRGAGAARHRGMVRWRVLPAVRGEQMGATSTGVVGDGRLGGRAAKVRLLPAGAQDAASTEASAPDGGAAAVYAVTSGAGVNRNREL